MKKVISNDLEDSNGKPLKVGNIYQGYSDSELIMEFMVLSIAGKYDEENIIVLVNPKEVESKLPWILKNFTKDGPVENNLSKEYSLFDNGYKFQVLETDSDSNTALDEDGNILEEFILIQNTVYAPPAYDKRYVFIKSAARVVPNGRVACEDCPVWFNGSEIGDLICKQCEHQLPEEYAPISVVGMINENYRDE